MAYQLSAGDVRTTRQYRAATAPVQSKAPFSAIPPSLIPGHRHHTFSATGTNTLTNGLLSFGPSSGTTPSDKAPATAYNPGGVAQDYFSMNPSPYRDFQPPPPPLPMPQSLLPQSVVPPRPPKTPVIMSPTIAPTLPPKPPLLMPPPNFLPPAVLSRSRSQPPPLLPRGASTPPHVPPPPLPPLPTPPSKPLGARSPSLAVKRSPKPQTLSQPNVSPSAKPSSIVQEPNDTALPASLPSAKSPVEGSFGINEEQELELALKLSAQTERERANALLLAQDEDLARALEQSLVDSAPRAGPSGSRPGPLTPDNESVPSSSSTILRDAHPRSQKPVSRNVSLLPVHVQLKEDEELARRLEAEYDSERPAPSPETNQRVDPTPSETPPLPRYADIVGKETAAVNRSKSDASASPQVPQAQLNLARSRERLSNPDQANTPRRNSPSPAQRTSPRPESQTTTGSQEEVEALEHSPTSPQPPRPVVTPNQFVEPELLYGACKYPRPVIKPLLCLPRSIIALGNHTPPVGERPISGRLAKCPRSSLWERSADAYSGVKLAATLEATGKIKCYSD
ncbi:hypothetical protein F5888DRAFT_459997 [Russula emetica]|nr:hypothetical protein F5888DRAFT_459997 [Russula emetica]